METEKTTMRYMIYVTNALHMYMRTISTKLTNDNGKMILFNEWYKLGRELNTAIYKN